MKKKKRFNRYRVVWIYFGNFSYFIFYFIFSRPANSWCCAVMSVFFSRQSTKGDRLRKIRIFVYGKSWSYIYLYNYVYARSKNQNDAPVRNRIPGRKRDHSDRTDVQSRQPHTSDLRFVRPVPGWSAVERPHLGGSELAPEKNLSNSAARMDDRRQASGETGGWKSVQVCNPDDRPSLHTAVMMYGYIYNRGKLQFTFAVDRWFDRFCGLVLGRV